jgi:hypothetical protein
VASSSTPTATAGAVTRRSRLWFIRAVFWKTRRPE